MAPPPLEISLSSFSFELGPGAQPSQPQKDTSAVNPAVLQHEPSIELYRQLGVPHFKVLLMKTLGRFITWSKGDEAFTSLRRSSEVRPESDYFLRQSRDGLEDFALATHRNERVHLVFGALSAGAAAGFWAFLAVGHCGAWGLIPAASFSVLASVDCYCVMLQRYNRARILRVLDKIDQRSAAAPNQDAAPS